MIEKLTGWDIFFRIMTFAWPVLITFASFWGKECWISFKEKKVKKAAEKKEKRRFTEIVNNINLEQLFYVVRCGVENEPTATELRLVITSKDRTGVVMSPKDLKCLMFFGEYCEEISLKDYDRYGSIRKYLLTNNLAQEMKSYDNLILEPDFIRKIKSYITLD